MHRIDEPIPFTVRDPEAANLNSQKLELAYDKLVNEFPSMYSLLIVKDAQLVFERYRSGAAFSSAFSIKSITKSIMNALVGIAIRDGLIQSVDQYIVDIIPESELPVEMLKNLNGLQIRHLLSMTHGLEIEENSAEMLEIWRSPSWLQSILEIPLSSKPGERFQYCTCSTHLLSAIISKVTNVPASYYASRMLFWPLGIPVPLYWESDPQGINWGGTNMFLTPRILARFGQLYLADGVWNGQRILPSGWVDESLTYKSEGWSNYAQYGYLWWISTCEGIDYAFASGYGGQYVYVIPSLKSIIVLTANSDIEIKEMQSSTNPFIKDPSLLIRRFLLECEVS
ncbi:CubicO group peptidase (beta-lactamase class C family) [Paenibacillus castaneae]|uniref:serine hydrolase domain-containing protein n=1 Tax=Paenibacillus castaneae TaxID=474957 RepID=UPI000C9BE8F7|nr:serine hydrolase [Paenibacillus castaneae]NIK78045.1 CubicO group peptidase (beta-lactamase class C family) [Paenibacillus castaneae]